LIKVESLNRNSITYRKFEKIALHNNAPPEFSRIFSSE
jgi:hypothetical protein